MNAHPDSKKRAQRKFSKTQNTAPQNRRPQNQQETVILHLRTSSDLNDCSRTRPSTKVLATQQEVPNPHAAHKRQPKLFRTHPDGSEHRRTTTKTDKTDSETLQCQLSAGKLFRKKYFRQSSTFNRRNAQIFRHLSERQRTKNARNTQETRTMSIPPFSN